MSTLSRSWNLVKASWRVLSADEELILFPIISAITVVGIVIVFAVPGVLLYLADGNAVFGYILVFMFYLVLYTVIIFMNAALVGAAMLRLRGDDPTVGDGFRMAFSRLGTILGYALIASTVGVMLQALSDRGIIGNIVRSLLGTAWNLITYLVVPVFVVEDIGPIQAVKRSAALLKQTWGEQIIGNAGMGFVFFLFYLFATVIVAAGIFLGLALESNVLIILVAMLGALIYIALALVSSTLGGIYSAAVYRYAAEGQTGSEFATELVQNAFRVKR